MKTLSKTQQIACYRKNGRVTFVTEFAYSGKVLLQMLLQLQVF